MNPHFWEKRNVLVTGCNGHIGVEIVDRLSLKGANIAALDIGEKVHPLLEKNANVHYCSLDLTDHDKMKTFISGNDFSTCIHLAANSNVVEMNEHPEIAFKVNVQGAWQLFELMRRYLPACHLVFTSSNHVYGKQDLYPTIEASGFHGENIYGVTKGAADQIAMGYARVYKLPIAVARITNTFGGKLFSPGHLIPHTIRLLLKDENPLIRSDGQSRKGLLYMEDTLSGIILLTEKMENCNIHGEAFNFFPDKNMSVLEIVQTIISVMGKNRLTPIVEGKMRLENEIDIEFLDNKKAKEMLGWRIKYTFPDGISRAIAHDYKSLGE